MSDIVSFQPVIETKDTLAARTREAISSWLSTKPKTHDGHPVIAIRQQMYFKPVNRDGDTDHNVVKIVSFEDVSASVTDITPIFLRRERVYDVHDFEITDSHMTGYRDAHFMLSYDQSYLRLINSDLTLLLGARSGVVDFYHFAHGSLMLSKQSVARLSSSDWHNGAWAAPLLTAILPKTRSQHERLAQAADIETMNRSLYQIFARTSDNFIKASPRPIMIQNISQ
jgi:hypothetical protein